MRHSNLAPSKPATMAPFYPGADSFGQISVQDDLRGTGGKVKTAFADGLNSADKNVAPV